MAAQQWYSIMEYARAFNVSDMTIRRRIKTGRIAAELREGKYYIPVETTSGNSPAKTAPAPSQRPTFPAQETREYGEDRSLHATGGNSRDITMVRARESVERGVIGGESGSRLVPASIRSAMETNDTSLVDTHALIHFCESTLRRLQDAERRVGDEAGAKIRALEAQLRAKDMESAQLKQQVEDLQVLVKILEKR